MPDLSASFAKPFDLQIAALRLRLANQVGTAAWDDLIKSQHDRAFVVAGAMKADLLADLGKAVEKAIGEHRSIEKFRAEFRQIVTDRGWHGWTGEGTAKGEAWRTKVIYRTNMRTSYAAGRMAQLAKGKFKFWVYRHGGSLEPRLQHLAWDGLALPPDHPFWETHAPPNGWGCSCKLFGANTVSGIRRVGGDHDKALPSGWNTLDPKTGEPAGIDKGWGYKVGGSVADELGTGPGSAVQDLGLVEAKVATLPAEIGSDYGRSVSAQVDAAWARWVEDTRSGASHRPGLAGVMSREVLAALGKAGKPPGTAEIMVQPGLLRGAKAVRHGKSGDGLSPEQWQKMSQWLRSPDAVLLDEKTGRVLFLVGGSDGADPSQVPQLAIAIDYWQKVNRTRTVSNSVVSAYIAKRGSILARIASKTLTLLMGKVR